MEVNYEKDLIHKRHGSYVTSMVTAKLGLFSAIVHQVANEIREENFTDFDTCQGSVSVFAKKKVALALAFVFFNSEPPYDPWWSCRPWQFLSLFGL